jgi:hypothetical protein
MKFKTVVILGAGVAIGYALNTEGGRNQLTKVKDAGQRYLGRPDVQAKADDLAKKAKQKTSGLPNSVQSVAKQTIDKAQQATHKAGADGDSPATS